MSVVLTGSEYIEISDALIDDGAGNPDYPFSLIAWCKVADGDNLAEMAAFAVGDTGSTSQEVAIGTYTGDEASAYQRESTSQLALSSIDYTVDEWFLIIGVFTASDDWTVYLNGGNSGNNTNTRAPDSLDTSRIGARARSTPSNYFVGKIAEVAAYSKALDSTDIANLWNSGDGEPPENVASANLIFHRQLLSDSDEGSGSFTVADVNSPTYDGDHPFSRSTTSAITPSGVASGEAFGSPTISTGPVSISPTGVASAEAIGDAVLTSLVSISPAGIDSGEAFGSNTLTPGGVFVLPTGVTSEEAIGDAVVTVGGVSVSPAGIVSGEAFGATTITVEALILLPTGISSEEAFGDATLIPGAVSVSLGGIASAEAFGDPVLTPGAVLISPGGIASGEAFGSAIVTVGGLLLLLTGIASDEAFGDATVTPGGVSISPGGIASAETLGSVVLTPGGVSVSPGGIISAEAFGAVVLTPGSVSISPSGIGSGEAFGAIVITGGGQVLSPAGIGSGEAFGVVTITVLIKIIFNFDVTIADAIDFGVRVTDIEDLAVEV
ncbi:MAG: hypothetical protein KDJ65_01625 [Anaerolineae bacterium]|nr:hypothetical protein [Anaerolineae bacterium]